MDSFEKYRREATEKLEESSKVEGDTDEGQRKSNLLGIARAGESIGIPKRKGWTRRLPWRSRILSLTHPKRMAVMVAQASQAVSPSPSR